MYLVNSILNIVTVLEAWEFQNSNCIKSKRCPFQREAAVKQLKWVDGALYSGDDIGKICKVNVASLKQNIHFNKINNNNAADAVVADAGPLLAAGHLL